MGARAPPDQLAWSARDGGRARPRKLQRPRPSNPHAKSLLVVDYLAFAILMGVFGVVGITATANVSPNILASPTCNCIPSPEARLQELSVILLVISAVLAPIGITRKSTGHGAPAMPRARGGGLGPAYAGPSMRSGGLFFLGISLVVLGVALVAVPSFLVLESPILVAEGAVMVAFGLILAYSGCRSSHEVA